MEDAVLFCYEGILVLLSFGVARRHAAVRSYLVCAAEKQTIPAHSGGDRFFLWILRDLPVPVMRAVLRIRLVRHREPLADAFYAGRLYVGDQFLVERAAVIGVEVCAFAEVV